MKILIINTGGTFNKRYEPIKGELLVPHDDQAVEKIAQSFYALEYEILGIIYKDSLEFTDEDRALLGLTIASSHARKIIVVHGTDTIDQSADYLDRLNLKREIIFTGAMVPFFIDPIEATANFSLALGFLLGNTQKGTFIAMHGSVLPYKELVKDRVKGVFKRINSKSL